MERTDAERATDIRNELRPHLNAVADVLEKSKQLGLTVRFDIGNDSNNRVVVKEITISKPL